MRRALVVYESMFGNTEAVARAVAEGLAVRMQTEVVPVQQAVATVRSSVDLLVVAAPTHAFGLSRLATRRSAVEQGARPTGGADVGMREWLGRLPPTSVPRLAAAVDTRIRKRGIPGSAARGAARRLRRLGYDVVEPMSFWVQRTSGPLEQDELRRARTWGFELALHPPSRTPVSARETAGRSRDDLRWPRRVA